MSTESLTAILSDCFPSSSCLLYANVGNNTHSHIKETKKWLPYKIWCSLSVPRCNALPQSKPKLLMLVYADDMTAVLSDISSAKALLDLLEVFKKPPGLMINTTKTEGMWIGSSRENKAKPLRIKWPNEPIKALGVHYTYDLGPDYMVNFSPGWNFAPPTGLKYCCDYMVNFSPGAKC